MRAINLEEKIFKMTKLLYYVKNWSEIFFKEKNKKKNHHLNSY
jgi:hypothetical protein